MDKLCFQMDLVGEVVFLVLILIASIVIILIMNANYVKKTIF